MSPTWSKRCARRCRPASRERGGRRPGAASAALPAALPAGAVAARAPPAGDAAAAGPARGAGRLHAVLAPWRIGAGLPQCAEAAPAAPLAEAGACLVRYPEWDRLIGRHRPDWVCVVAAQPRPFAPESATPLRQDLDREAVLMHRLRRRLSAEGGRGPWPAHAGRPTATPSIWTRCATPVQGWRADARPLPRCSLRDAEPGRAGPGRVAARQSLSAAASARS